MAWSGSGYRKLKWLSLVVAGLSLGFAVATFWRNFAIGRSGFMFVLSNYCLWVESVANLPDGWIFQPFGVPSPRGIRTIWLPASFAGPGLSGIILPLWIPTLIAVIATVYFHRKARPVAPGHCLKCGYNLTGNESGVCPECGTQA